MSYHILSETENSFERTIVYQTMHENFVVIVQQKHLSEQEDWTTKDHCMLPKIFEFHCSVARQTSINHSGVSLHQGVLYHLQYSLTLCKLTIYRIYQRDQSKLIINTIAPVFLSMKTSSVFCQSVTT